MRIFKNLKTLIKNYLTQRKIKIYKTINLITQTSNQFLKILIFISANVLTTFCKIILLKKESISQTLKTPEEDKTKNKKKKEFKNNTIILSLNSFEVGLKHLTKY